jgi:hypothetical protein
VTRPCLRISVEEGFYLVQPHHYEALRDSLDRGDEGWQEFELAEHPAGRCFVRLEDITDLGYYPAEWCEVKDEHLRADSLEGGG